MGGTVLICGGTLMAVLTAGLSKPTALSGRPHSLKRQYMGETVNSELYLSYLALSVVSALVLHCVHKRYDKAFHRGTPLPGHRYVAPASYAAFSAIFGAQYAKQMTWQRLTKIMRNGKLSVDDTASSTQRCSRWTFSMTVASGRPLTDGLR